MILDARTDVPARIRERVQSAHADVLTASGGPGALAAADALARDVYVARERRDNNPLFLAEAALRYGDVLRRRGRCREADPMLLRAHGLFHERGADSPYTDFAAELLARLYHACGRADEAEPYLQALPDKHREWVLRTMQQG